ncbi:hypothetical protein M569_04606 [Genlisea aurea]|uniref:Uncharacterized protein n=1 Tax=Genlisea aurea TaxID=192259 RepID=S8CYQ2_9LAMI|nr:hypothetical protein M569_04606 [Genlisea aurea]
MPYASILEKRRWGSWWSYWCFGSIKHRKQIVHSVLITEPNHPLLVTPILNNLTTHAPPPQPSSSSSSSILFPFIAPPSSPTSFIQSDPSSAPQSPRGISLLSARASSIDPATVFKVGPYAHETQLVSPPVFSAFTTEPSTASFTPPPEPLQMMTTGPSSPEVPFAELLSSSLVDHRMSFEVFGEEIPICVVEQGIRSPSGEYRRRGDVLSFSEMLCDDYYNEKHRTISFDFDNLKEVEVEEEGENKSCEWLSRDEGMEEVEKEWSFFSVLQSTS